MLESNGETAGIAIDFACGGRRAAHIIVHDPRARGLRPGTLLVEEWIRGASADGIATFDLLAPGHAYKMDWADGAVAVEDFALGLTLAGRPTPPSTSAWCASALKAAAEALPRVIGRLRRWRAVAGSAPAPTHASPVSGAGSADMRP